MSFISNLANITGVNVVSSDTTVFRPPLIGIDVFTAGDLSIVDHAGTTITRTFPTQADGGSYPHRWMIRIRQVRNTDTTIVNAALLGLRS